MARDTIHARSPWRTPLARPDETGSYGYPRPLLRRADWTSLDGVWSFALDPEAALTSPAEVAWKRAIEVPFAPETIRSGIGETGFLRACWYRRFFEAPRLRDGERLILHFGAVDYAATVWIEGSIAGRHEGGYTPFSLDITDLLQQGKAVEIVVRAEDDPHDLAKPREKQDWEIEPHSIWYPRTTGIWQTVWMERVPATRRDPPADRALRSRDRRFAQSAPLEPSASDADRGRAHASMEAMMRVLVTGGAGYIGSVVTERLLEGGHEVTVYDNLSRGHRDAVLPGAELVDADLHDGETLRRTLEQHRIEAVVHMAASSLVGESVANPAAYYHNNVRGGLTLFDAMRAAGVLRLVLSSTAAVYGEPEVQPIEETCPPAPTNPYGETKLVLERALRWYDHAYGLRWVSLRYFNAADATARCGERHTGPRRPGDPAVLVASSARIKRELGFAPAYQDLSRIIESAWEWMQREQAATSLPGQRLAG